MLGASSTVTELETGTAASQPARSPTFLSVFQPPVFCCNSSQEKPSFWSARFCLQAHKHTRG